ncbi:hypothetical protein ATY81_07460 [Rhizobium sp. R72]|uniref:hypothetical protein n=1 Tax=unclassified Rhizobium TaxID=2613769 RepID=UPI000B5372E1|nr:MULTISPECIES: hypothetical protein [unclassified Rhizobium]OWV97282.1 hypothetical protein ATY81_07460 [Rhizobium sp. R72]OWV97621.1 hypothetical protein ATY80_07460 [Rhizobium sp. R711]
MKSGLGTITIADDGYGEHVAYELSERSGLLFARQEFLIRAKGAKDVRLSLLTARTEYVIRIGSVEASCANFSILRDINPS